MRRASAFGALICASLAATAASALSPFTVFFAPGSATLDAQAKAILDQAAMGWRSLPAGDEHSDIQIFGYTDRRGSFQSNRRLSCARAEAVRTYLAKRGVIAGRIMTEGWGELLPEVDTADGQAEPHNRRVVVIFVAPGDNARKPVSDYRC